MNVKQSLLNKDTGINFDLEEIPVLGDKFKAISHPSPFSIVMFGITVSLDFILMVSSSLSS